MLLAQISHTHLVAAGPRRASRLAALKQALSYIATLEPRPAAVIHTGDLTHNARPEQYDLARSYLADLGVEVEGPELFVPDEMTAARGDLAAGTRERRQGGESEEQDGDESGNRTHLEPPTAQPPGRTGNDFDLTNVPS